MKALSESEARLPPFSFGNMLFDREITVRSDRNRIDPEFNEFAGEFGVVARGLSAQTNLRICFMGLFYDGFNHPQNSWIFLVEQIRQILGVAVNSER